MAIDRKNVQTILLGFLILAGLWATRLYSYLLFHSLIELFSVCVAFVIFMLAWNTRQFLKNSYLLFIGIAYLFVGALDMLHTLSYKGMGVFQGHDANLPTQLWIVARYLESLTLSFALFFGIKRNLRPWYIFGGFGVTITFLLMAIFYWDVFPTCFVEGVGLTPFKKVSEYIISLLLIASGIFLFSKRDKFEVDIFRLLIASIGVTIASELAFTLYVDAYGLSNLIGHYLKFISFCLIYAAIIQTGLNRPFALLFNDLKRGEAPLIAAKENLELQVMSRTAELTQTNQALLGEIEERELAEERLQEYQQRLKSMAFQVVLAEENERRSIAENLHDHVGHALALARMQLNGILESKSELETHILVNDVSNLLLKGLQDTRSLIFDLSSPSMNEIGLSAAISEWLEEQITNRHGIKTDLIDHVKDHHRKALDKNLRALLFRSVRELLTNVVKHGRANKVQVQLSSEGADIKIVITDDGIGFTPGDVIVMGENEGGFGLFSIRERMGDLGGSFEILSEPGKGCQVTLTCPIGKGMT